MTPSGPEALFGGGLALLILERVFTFIRASRNGMNGHCKAGDHAAPLQEICRAVEKLADIEVRQQTLIEQVSHQVGELHDSHHGPRAIDHRGGLRWHGTEVAEEIRQLKDVIVKAQKDHGDTQQRLMLQQGQSIAQAFKDAMKEDDR